MLGPGLNPYEKPLYFSVALTLLGLAWMTLLLERTRINSPLYEEPAGCGVVSTVRYVRSPADSLTSVRQKRGAHIFRGQCASCHNKNMKDNLTGPALGGVEKRWASYPRGDLYAWIRNSQSMINAGHPRAIALWEEWQPTVMSNYPLLTDEEIESLLAYIDLDYY